MSATDRLAEVAQRVGLDADDATLAGWATLLERVESGLAGHVSPALAAVAAVAAVRPATSPPASRPGGGPGAELEPLPDDSPWVWLAPPPTGPRREGYLAGLRLAVKDLIAVEGRPIRAGSRARAMAPPEPRDAPPVAALRAAGAELVGTTKLHEFAFGVTGLNATDGTADNPAAPGRVPGGSSSGSAAAVAAGLADVALGSDTGGSSRIPAALCGVVGYKPARGLVATTATYPLSPTLDHLGWFTADVATARRVAEVLRVPLGAPGSGPGPRGLILGVHRSGLDGADGAVTEAFGRACEALARAGVTLLDVDWSWGEEVFATSSAIMFAEASYVHRASLERDASLYGADVAARLIQGSAITLPTYLAARERRTELRQRCLAVLDGIPMGQARPLLGVITPTTSTVAPLRADATDPAVAARLVANTRLANVTGLPAVSLPVGGCPLPVGLQIEAINDAALFAVAEVVAPIIC